MIGIVGGMGPLAGIDLSKKIINQTIAGKDQDHISQILISTPENIGDRTEYIQNKIKLNPAHAISEIILKLESVGATVVGLPCNSAHSPQIYNVIQENMQKAKTTVKLLHMIEEVGKFIKIQFPNRRKIGVLSTSGTYETRQYNLIEKFGLEIINVSEEEVEQVHQSIYNSDYGIKTNSEKISELSLKILSSASETLISKDAEVIILGCTELPLAFTQKHYKNLPLIDSNLVLARALIAAVDPNKLKTW